jgi:hypothetical protein
VSGLRRLAAAALSVAVLVAVLPAAPASAVTRAAHGGLAGPLASCSIPAAGSATMGQATLRFSGGGAPNFRDAKVKVSARGLTPGSTYEVFVVELFISDGKPVGCAGFSVGAFTASRTGHGHFVGGREHSFFSGPRTMQVFITDHGFPGPSFQTGPLQIVIP